MENNEKKYLTGNKGEWSEIYVLFKLLADGGVYAGDANMEKLETYYPILQVIRQEVCRYTYIPDIERNIIFIHENGEEISQLPVERFIFESNKLLKSLKNKDKKRAFALPETEMFMNNISCCTIKAPSKKKADIEVVIRDPITNMTPTLGFSIKSQLGSPSTLLNPGESTNIVYKINGEMTDDEMNRINSIGSHLDKVHELYKSNYTLEFDSIPHPIFRNNLFFLDSYMPKFIADCLLFDSVYGNPNVTAAVNHLAETNPLQYPGNAQTYYEHKMKQLLLATALGMTPAKEWTGRFDANGGYLVVRKDGEIVCYHFYNQNEVEDYLYNNTRFDRASRTRYKYGSIYKSKDGKYYFKLNLQIRFKV